MAGTSKAGTKLANVKNSWWAAWLDYLGLNLMAGFQLESHQNVVLFILYSLVLFFSA